MSLSGRRNQYSRLPGIILLLAGIGLALPLQNYGHDGGLSQRWHFVIEVGSLGWRSDTDEIKSTDELRRQRLTVDTVGEAAHIGDVNGYFSSPGNSLEAYSRLTSRISVLSKKRFGSSSATFGMVDCSSTSLIACGSTVMSLFHTLTPSL